MLGNEIGWHDLQIRQVSGKFADCAVQFANWPDWQIGLNSALVRTPGNTMWIPCTRASPFIALYMCTVAVTSSTMICSE